MKSFERGFIVGLIEGEGTISLSVGKGKTRNSFLGLSIEPLIQIANTSEELINKANMILGWRKRVIKREKAKILYLSITRSIDLVQNVLEEINCDLVSKKKRGELLLEFCKIRKTKYKGKIRRRLKGVGYTDREFEIVKEIAILNSKNGKGTSTHISPDEITLNVENLKKDYLASKERILLQKFVTRKCLFCGKEFITTRGKLTSAYNKNIKGGSFCTRRCNGYAWKAKQLGLTFEQARVKWIDKLRPIGICF